MNKKFQLARTTTDSKILEQLSRDRDWTIRYWATQNPNTSVETLNFLSRDEEYNVRCNVVWNSNTPFETLKQMAIHDESDHVRNLILQNPNCNDDLYMYIQGRKLLQMLNKEQMYS